MNKFFIKASALVFVCFGTSLVFGMEDHTPTSITGIVADISGATTRMPVTMPMQQCVLDFSNPSAILSSTAKIGFSLLSEKMTGKLDLLDIVYLTLEGVAAGSRQNPSRFGSVASFFSDPNAVYTSFGHILGTMSTAQHDLSVLADLAQCTAFVRGTITTDLPILLNDMKAPADIRDGLVTMLASPADPLVPMFAGLLNKSYLSLSATADAAAAALQDVEARVKTKCGCWPF